jgi:hypothetical protein
MGLKLGIDVGTVSAKWALVGPRARIEELQRAAAGAVERIHPFTPDPARAIAVSRYRRVQGRPLDAVMQQIGELLDPRRSRASS